VSDIVAVVNPAAGGGRASQVWQRLSAEGPASQIGVIRTAGVSSTASELRACVESGVKRILVVGGDGSMHQIANMLLELDYA
jgi:diacylglycerol kinase family enzyme